jgi:hypothetical protein
MTRTGPRAAVSFLPPWRVGHAWWMWDPRISTLAANAAVASHPDSGPLGVTAVQSTGSAQPALRRGASGINGLPAFSFDGGDHLQADGAASPFTGSDKPFTVLSVVQPSSAGTQGVPWSLGRGSSSTPSARLRLTSGDQPACTRTDDGNTTKSGNSTHVLLMNQPAVLLHRFSGVDGDIWCNAQQVLRLLDLDVGTITLDRMSIGARRGASVTNNWTGLLGLTTVLAGWVTAPAAAALCRWAMREYRLL